MDKINSTSKNLNNKFNGNKGKTLIPKISEYELTHLNASINQIKQQRASSKKSLSKTKQEATPQQSCNPSYIPSKDFLEETCYITSDINFDKSSNSNKPELTPLQKFLEKYKKSIEEIETTNKTNFVAIEQVIDKKEILYDLKAAYSQIISYLTKHGCFYTKKISKLNHPSKIVSKYYYLLTETQWEELADFGFRPNYSQMETYNLKQIITFMTYKLLAWLNYHKTKNSLSLLSNSYTNRRLLRYIKAISKNYDVLPADYKRAFELLNSLQLKALATKGLTIEPQHVAST